jgi:hypothetical protein
MESSNGFIPKSKKGGYMSKMQESNQTRRKFLKTAGVGGAVVAIGSLSLTGCSGEHTQKEVIKGKSKKQEVLYRDDTTYWQTYFSVAK